MIDATMVAGIHITDSARSDTYTLNHAPKPVAVIETIRINVTALTVGDAIKVKTAAGWAIVTSVTIKADGVAVEIHGWSQARVLTGFVRIATRH